MKQYKYLVVAGCSLSYGFGCPTNQTYGQLLADKLGLKLINLSTPGSGWRTLTSTVSSFINNNRDILHECFFILQKSLLAREIYTPEYEVPLHRTDVWEPWNIKYMSAHCIDYHGYIDWNAPFVKNKKPDWWDNTEPHNRRHWGHIPEYVPEQIPEHNENVSRLIKDIKQFPYLYEQFEEVMLNWATRISSFHFLLKNLDVDHIIVDGYSPFVSYKLNFTNYYDEENKDMHYNIEQWWSNENCNYDEEIRYDFKNIKSGWVFDKIDIKYKIDDVVLRSLFMFFKTESEWNVDGAHAGPTGMKLIADVLYTNLVKKGWF